MIGIDTEKTVEQMNDAELADVLKLAELMDSAKLENERRRAEASGAREIPIATTSVKRITDAPCPSCGRNDTSIASKTLYADDSLARGRVVGTAAYCGPCRVWYDAGTGKLADMRHTY